MNPSLPCQGYLYPGSMLLHHHGVLCPGTAVWGAESRQEDPAVPAHGLGHGYRWGNELSSPPQDHPQRPQVTQVSLGEVVCYVPSSIGKGSPVWWGDVHQHQIYLPTCCQDLTLPTPTLQRYTDEPDLNATIEGHISNNNKSLACTQSDDVSCYWLIGWWLVWL